MWLNQNIKTMTLWAAVFLTVVYFTKFNIEKKHIKMTKTMALLGFIWINYIETVQLENTLLFNKYYLTIITS